MAAPKGNEYYKLVEKKPGKPLEFTEEYADRLAEDFLEWWYANPDAFWFYEYFSEVRRMSKQKVNRLKEKSKKLEDALEEAFDSQEGRIYRGSMVKVLSEGMSKFGLACVHKWAPEKQKIEISADDSAKTILDKISGKSSNMMTND